MPVYRVPVVYDETTKRQRPATCCEKISPEYFHFELNSILYSDSSNSLRVQNNKLVCYSVSKADTNMLKYGADGGAYLDGNDVLSNDSANLLHVAARDKKLLLTSEQLQESGFISKSSRNADLRAIISLDEHNALTIGSDGKLFVRAS